jgi:hypothetical protein
VPTRPCRPSRCSGKACPKHLRLVPAVRCSEPGPLNPTTGHPVCGRKRLRRPPDDSRRFQVRTHQSSIDADPTQVDHTRRCRSCRPVLPHALRRTPSIRTSPGQSGPALRRVRRPGAGAHGSGRGRHYRAHVGGRHRSAAAGRGDPGGWASGRRERYRRRLPHPVGARGVASGGGAAHRLLRLGGKMGGIYLDVRNLLNRQNVVAVRRDIGSPPPTRPRSSVTRRRPTRLTPRASHTSRPATANRPMWTGTDSSKAGRNSSRCTSRPRGTTSSGVRLRNTSAGATRVRVPLLELGARLGIVIRRGR